MSTMAPIAIFSFNRPQHTRRTLEALLRCEGVNESQIVVFGDGPRNATDHETVDSVRRIVKSRLGSSAEYVFQESNCGLSRSIIRGVSDLCSRFGRVIVIEDDLEVAPSFLLYMNEALEKYANADQVFQVSAHMFDVPELEDRESVVFLPLTTTWGWGTWHRAWKYFDPQASGWTEMYTNADLRRRFNVGGVYDYFSMLENQMSGRRDSWGIRWYWTVFKHGGLTCFPPRSLVINRGMDGSGTHGRGLLRRFGEGGARKFGGANCPACGREVRADRNDFEAVRKAIWRQNGGWLGYAVDRVRALKGRVRQLKRA